MINTLIMSSNHLGNENVVIDMSYTISHADQAKREIDINDIDRSNQKDVINEIDRLKCFLLKWNIHADPKPPPLHIKFEDYGNERRNEYQEAKTKYYKHYTDTCKELNDNIKTLQAINTKLCIDEKKIEDDIKIKEGTFYNKEEQEHLKMLAKLRADSRRETNQKYYDKNKDKISKKKLIKKLKAKNKALTDLTNGVEGKDINDKFMVKSTCVIKPYCCCGSACDTTKFETIKKHSKSVKHLLFKSIIKLIHYRRRTKKIKSVINKINRDLMEYKKVVKVDGKTRTNKRNSEIIILYNDSCHPMNENETHQPREPWINKVDYTDEYREEVVNLKFRNKRRRN